jgi:deoxyribodipyrimidine photolyase-related protein
MSNPQNVLLLYPHQLYAAELLPNDVDQVFMIEDPLMFGRDPQYPLLLHKQKLVLHRASMRRYVEEVLWPAGYQVEYIEFHHMIETGDIVNKLVHAERVEYFDPTDDVLGRKLRVALDGLEHKPIIRVLESPNFYLTAEEVKAFFEKRDKANFTEFYQWQRERFNILINPETYKPLGGKLSFDTENRKRLPKDHVLPTFQVYGSNEFVAEAKKYIEHHFADNPGSADDFPWPTNHEEASAWLDEFLESRIDNFGPYEDAIDGQAPWVYHSALSPMMNIGLLSPVEVVNRAVARHAKKEVPLASLEGFVRQILGWREYMRGMYLDRHVALRTTNAFDHQRHLTNDWYTGTTGIQPVDDVIKKTNTRSYAHHIERLMVMGNMMFLCEFHPDEVYRWFMEMYIDAYDWVMVPNVYGMSQYSDGGSMTTKPYISSSNYILSMSRYERGQWSDVWDGLYWRFIEKNREVFAKNPRMRMMVQQLDKLQENRKRIISYRAEDFLKDKTLENEQ